MTPQLIDYLCEPVTKAPLKLTDAVTDIDGHILSGKLVAPSGVCYPIINGIPRLLIGYKKSHLILKGFNIQVLYFIQIAL